MKPRPICHLLKGYLCEEKSAGPGWELESYRWYDLNELFGLHWQDQFDTLASDLEEDYGYGGSI